MHHGKPGRIVLPAVALFVALAVPAGTAAAGEPVFLNGELVSPERSGFVQSEPAPAPGQPAADDLKPDRYGTAEDRRADRHEAEQGEVRGQNRDERQQGNERPRGDEHQQEKMRAETPRPGGHSHDRPIPARPKPELTAKQQKELARLYEKLYETQKKLINKYAEFGVITKEQASLWLNRLEARHEKLKANGYVPVWKRCVRPEKSGMAG